MLETGSVVLMCFYLHFFFCRFNSSPYFCFLLSHQQWKLQRFVCEGLAATVTWGRHSSCCNSGRSKRTETETRSSILFLSITCYTFSISVLCGHCSNGRCPREAAANDSAVKVTISQVIVMAVAATKVMKVAVLTVCNHKLKTQVILSCCT